MARNKVTLERIANGSARRATFKKRRQGLMKKARELATLCDVDACVVVYGEGESQPVVWPSVAEAARVLARFRAMPELDQCKKMMDMEGFLKQQVDKLTEQLHKARRENHEREVKLLLHDAIAGRRPGLVGLSVEELASLRSTVEDLLQKVRKAIENLHAAQGGHQQGLPATALQVQLPQAASSGMSLPPLVPYAAASGVGHTDVLPAQNLQYCWMMDVPRPGGELGAMVYGGGSGTTHQQGFGGAASASNMGAGISQWWPDAGQSFPPM